MRRLGRVRAAEASILLALAWGLVVDAGTLHAQTPRIRAQVDTTLVTVGDRITLTVSVDHPADARVVWPDSVDLGPFDVLEARALPPASLEEGVRSAVSLALTAFELGDLEIPSLDVEVVGPGGESTRLTTDRFGIQVVSVGLDEGGDIRDVKGPLGIPRGAAQLFLMALVLILGLVATYALLRWWRRRDGGADDGVPVVPARPPHEIALEALARLEASPLLERGEVKTFHIQVSEILRVYVEGRFSVPALEMTTREVTGGLEGAGADPSIVERFRRFLDQCDMVKFAKFRPFSDESAGVLALGRELVVETVPSPEPVEDVAEPPPGAIEKEGPPPSGQEIGGAPDDDPEEDEEREALVPGVER